MIIDVSDIHLQDLRAFVTRRDGARVNFSGMLEAASFSDNVNIASSEMVLTATGPADQVLRIGLEGSTVAVTAPAIDIQTGQPTRSEIFRGVVTDLVDDDEPAQDQVLREMTCHDILWYFKTEGDWVFKNNTLSQILHGLCDAEGVPKAPVYTGEFAQTTEPLGPVIGRGTTMWNVLQEAIQRHFDKTGEVYRAFARKGRVNLRKQGDQDRWWVFERGRNLAMFRRTRSLEELVNDVRVYGVFEGEHDKPKLESRYQDARSQELYGTLARVEYIPSAEDADATRKMAQKVLEQYKVPTETVEVQGWIVPTLRAGEQIRIRNPNFDINNMYYLESAEARWSATEANSVAVCRRDPIDPGLLLEEVKAV